MLVKSLNYIISNVINNVNIQKFVSDFTMDDLNWFLEKSIYIITWVAAISFIYTLINAVYWLVITSIVEVYVDTIYIF